MRSRYELMKKSTQTNIKGKAYPDILSFPINNFKLTESATKVVITQRYLERFYLLSYDYYNVTYYDDVILWLNGISSIDLIKAGDLIYLPSKADLENFYIENGVQN